MKLRNRAELLKSDECGEMMYTLNRSGMTYVNIAKAFDVPDWVVDEKIARHKRIKDAEDAQVYSELIDNYSRNEIIKKQYEIEELRKFRKR